MKGYKQMTVYIALDAHEALKRLQNLYMREGTRYTRVETINKALLHLNSLLQAGQAKPKGAKTKPPTNSTAHINLDELGDEFTTGEFIAHLGGSRRTGENNLQRLLTENKIKRIQKGVYAKN